MTYSQLKKLTPEELAKNLDEQYQELRKLRFAHAISPLEKPMRLREGRKKIARIKTLQNERKYAN